MHRLVDGMNVIGTRPNGWWHDRHGAMVELVARLEEWAAASGEDVAVVFERPPAVPIRSTIVEVAHAPRARPNAADDEIVRRLRAAPADAVARTVVVTSDRQLADLARAAGAAVEPSAPFRDRIDPV